MQKLPSPRNVIQQYAKKLRLSRKFVMRRGKMKDYFKKEQGKKIRLARKAFGKKLTQKKMAKAMNIPLRTYQSYEIGEANPPDVLLIQIANFLGVDVKELKFGPGRGRNLSAEIRELIRQRDEIESRRYRKKP